jgi:diaminopimelate decarboxylase
VDDSRFRLTDDEVRTIAQEFGTPVYVLCEEAFRSRIQRYQNAFRDAWQNSEISFASKSNSILALLAIAHEEGCAIDVASEGELRAALLAGVPAKHCHFHGNAKTRRELKFAVEQGIGQIMVDNFEEIEHLRELGAKCEIMLRLAPGVDPKTHEKISTGQSDTKFGFNIPDGSAEKALLASLAAGLSVIGFHCHVGSQLLDAEAQRQGGEELARFAALMFRKHGFVTQEINVGGGLGVRYQSDLNPMAVEDYCKLVVDAKSPILAEVGLSPRIGQEPGRSLIAEAGVTIYEVLVVKHIHIESGLKTYVSVDGGLSDNPRPVMYGAKYDVLHTSKTAREGIGEQLVTISGKHCETDELFADVYLPESTQAGDYLQVLCTGAYNACMASNYNRFLRPPTLLLCKDGSKKVIQERETWEELFSRETR